MRLSRAEFMRLQQRQNTGAQIPVKKIAKPSKYKNVKAEVGGIRFDSKKEAHRWGELKLMERAKVITKLERQVRYPLVVNGNLIATYVCDFKYERDGATVVEDVKSPFTKKMRDYRMKWKLMLQCHGIAVREV